MTLIAAAYLLIVSGLLGFSLSRFWPEGKANSQISAWLIGATLCPSFVSLATLIVFECLDGLIAAKEVYLLGPMVVAIAIARYSYLLTSEIPVIPPKVVDIRKIMLMALFLLLTFGSLIGLLVVNVANPQIDHDISVYLIEALSISRHMEETSAAWPGSAVDQPHGLAYSVYLAWGFLFERSAGYGSDMAPRMLVAFNHVVALLAVAALVLRNANWYWAVICTALVLINPIWRYEINAFARDTYYVAPVLGLLALLLASKAGKSRRDIGYGFAVALAAAGSMTGHSLGILGAAAVFSGAGIIRILQDRGAIFRNISFWTAGFVIAIGGGFRLVELLASGASRESGFAFPFYTDPFLKNAFLSASRWAESPSVTELTSALLEYNNINPALAVFGIALVALATVRVRQRPELSTLRLACLSTISSAVLLFLLVVLFPATLDGLTLSSAFASNLRYGFLLGLLFVISVVLASQILVLGLSEKISIPLTFAILLLTVATVYPATRKYWPGLDSENRVAYDREDICEFFLQKGIENIYVDGDDFIYVCPDISHYLFTEAGARLMSLQDDEGIAGELENQNIEGVLLLRNIPYWWSGANLYRFLQSNWTLVPSDYGAVFVKPER